MPLERFPNRSIRGVGKGDITGQVAFIAASLEWLPKHNKKREPSAHSFLCAFLQHNPLPRFPGQPFGDLVLNIFSTRDGLANTQSRKISSTESYFHFTLATSALFSSVLLVAIPLALSSVRGLLGGTALTPRAGTCLRFPFEKDTLRQSSEPTRMLLAR
jgi:hypothetical protein